MRMRSCVIGWRSCVTAREGICRAARVANPPSRSFWWMRAPKSASVMAAISLGDMSSAQRSRLYMRSEGRSNCPSGLLKGHIRSGQRVSGR